MTGKKPAAKRRQTAPAGDRRAPYRLSKNDAALGGPPTDSPAGIDVAVDWELPADR